MSLKINPQCLLSGEREWREGPGDKGIEMDTDRKEVERKKGRVGGSGEWRHKKIKKETEKEKRETPKLWWRTHSIILYENSLLN